MSLNIEIGGTEADSYGTLADFTAFATSMGWSLKGDTAEHEANLRRAALFLDREYSWLGRKVAPTQSRAWPRYVSTADKDGFAIPADAIPQAIIDAQFELAYLENQGNDLMAFNSGPALKSKRTKVGPLDTQVEYDNSSNSEGRIRAIEGLLRGYISGGVPGSESGVVRLARG